MKGRKWVALALCAALCAALILPVGAAGEADQALMAVTAQVKETLGLDTQGFDDFQGWSDEDVLLGKRWNLEWDGDGVWLFITADDNGKIYSYNLSETVPDEEPVANWYMGGKMNIPRLPKDKSQAAFAAAQDFLSRVLEVPVETVELENTYTPSLRQSNYRYAGTVLLNGLDSPITCSVTVRASDLAVTRFWRSDESAGYLGGVPGKATAYTADQARRLLGSQVKMEARYVLRDSQEEKVAVVRYVPLSGDDYFVDGQSGQLVDLTELRAMLWRSAVTGGNEDNKLMFDAAAAESVAYLGAGLTQAERDGAALLAGAQDKETLDQAVQNTWPEMGLGSYTLASASYAISRHDLPDGQTATADDCDITCRLTYGKQEGPVTRNKYVTVDAKTGQLLGLYSRRSYQGDGKDNYIRNLTAETAQRKANEFLKSFSGGHYSQLALAETIDGKDVDSWQHTYSYQQTAAGFFYPGNFYTIGVDATDGTISSVESSFDDDVVLQAPAHTVTADEAAQVYIDAMSVPYGYLEVPVSISLAGNDLMPLLKEAGYTYVMALKTGWVMTQPDGAYIQGVDAESGQIVSQTLDPDTPAALTYDDLEGHWVESAAQALAVFGIGLRGGSLRPADELTQLDMVALLCGVDGYIYDPESATQSDTDWLYNHAYALGLVTPESRSETKVISRGELVRLVLDAAGYSRVANLPGIFRCDFSDRDAIPAEQAGYAALAQGFGLIQGGSDGAYAADRSATRAEAIAMLYQYMK